MGMGEKVMKVLLLFAASIVLASGRFFSFMLFVCFVCFLHLLVLVICIDYTS